MRLNKYVALASGMSRRAADDAIVDGRVRINGHPVELGQKLDPDKDTVTLDGKKLAAPGKSVTIILNKPASYVVSRDGQGNKTIYELLPPELHALKPVGRLDKYSSGLLLITNDGALAYELTHPSFQKEKIYEIELDHNLSAADFETVTNKGVPLEDGPSRLGLDLISDNNREWKVTMTEGRNRQIRRTFETLGYKVKRLHRTHFGPYELGTLNMGEYTEV